MHCRFSRGCYYVDSVGTTVVVDFADAVVDSVGVVFAIDYVGTTV